MFHIQYTVGGAPIYDFSCGKSLPEYLEEARKQKRSLRYDKEYRNRIEILQNFDFTVASSKIRVSPDGQYIAGIGTYPPELRLFDIYELSMKFLRRFDFEVHDFLFLSEDYKKLAFLMTDRVIEFHAQGGHHCRIRVPKQGRGIEYMSTNAEMLIFGSTSEVFRLDLEAGIFLKPINTKFEFINTGKVNPTLPIILLGGNNGSVELWDTRNKKVAASLKVSSSDNLYINKSKNNIDFSEFDYNTLDKGSRFDWYSMSNQEQVTTSTFSKDGLRFVLGLSSGNVLIYDIRSSHPLEEKSHKNDLPIMDLHFTNNLNSDSEILITADRQTIKMWNENRSSNRKDGLIGTISTEYPISSICTYPNSGLIMVTGDQTRVGMYYVPTLGVAPRWCSFLDSITEELEEEHLKNNSRVNNSQLYDEYQFITNNQLREWGIEHLIGTPLLKAYLHGYLISSKLYKDLHNIINPIDYEQYRKDILKKKLEERAPMRIPIRKGKNLISNTKINKRFIEKLNKKARGEEGNESETGLEHIKYRKLKKNLKKGQQQCAQALLSDSRFSKLFNDTDYIIDEEEGL
ncbi:uncharacterized protein CMU_030070 [Cryptosporidium muris RN66]|uniref:NUC153 domain-containing protein n=1 Tax=Cryptosporidium muris (strain RN66) TaxID=441375 RepID=B6AI90_CRYMR|nr:uncharacterized protein CMU_030070 [Cryptosporidium muris RN66]EEA07931.1 hypothetical protein, conserved [Cryptosporidium muris RN66]|eukprot:XP_002142280.1 hypothetical protein [Cryptosporidium muris RN66]